jgi:predicted GIY-YIG superfamily endonuclease
MKLLRYEMSEHSSRGAAELQVPASVSIRQRLAYVSPRQHTSAYVRVTVSSRERIRQHTSASGSLYVSRRQLSRGLTHLIYQLYQYSKKKTWSAWSERVPQRMLSMPTYALTCVMSEVVELMIYDDLLATSAHTSAYVSRR